MLNIVPSRFDNKKNMIQLPKIYTHFDKHNFYVHQTSIHVVIMSPQVIYMNISFALIHLDMEKLFNFRKFEIFYIKCN